MKLDDWVCESIRGPRDTIKTVGATGQRSRWGKGTAAVSYWLILWAGGQGLRGMGLRCWLKEELQALVMTMGVSGSS